MAPKPGRLRGLLTLIVSSLFLWGLVSCTASIMAENAGLSQYYGPLTKSSRAESGLLKHSGRTAR